MDQAQGDLEQARSSVDLGHYDWASSAAQQAAEKATKAVFQKLGAEAHGHAVAQFLEALTSRRTVDSSLIDAARELDSVYLPSRYRDALPAGSPRRTYTRTMAERLVDNADRIVRFCQDLPA